MSRTFKRKSFGLIDIPHKVPTHSHKKIPADCAGISVLYDVPVKARADDRISDPGSG